MDSTEQAAEPAEGWFGATTQLRAALVSGALLLAWFVLSRFGVGAVAEGAAWMSLGIGMIFGGRAAWDALRAKQFDIDVLMVVAAGLAAAVGHPQDGALLLFLFVLAGALEDRAMARTMRAVEALHKMMPKAAMVWRAGTEARRHDSTKPEGSWVEVDPAEVRVGDRMRVRSGELVAADAVVVDGSGSMDQSTLTGESMPRDVGPGDEIYAGTLNAGQPMEARVLRPAAESGLRKILDLVLRAQKQREPVQRVIDRMSQPYAIGVMVASTVVFLVWWLAFGRTVVSEDGSGALDTAIALLIVASPCALVIATPTATLAAISRGARAGLLFKGGQSIERLARMRSVCLDKTGTLTHGRARLQQVHAVGWSDGQKLLSVAAALEGGSTHPIATAVVEAAASRGVVAAETAQLEDLPGRGLRAIVEGVEARLGTYDHCEAVVPVCFRARVREVLEKVRSRGQIGVVVAWAGRPVPGQEESGHAAVLVLSDTLRPGAADLAPRLHELGVRPVVMLTGDNRTTAAYIAGQLGLDHWESELLPEDKVRHVETMKREQRGSGGVAVIGDGVNDAPALAAADVSIAIGSIGSDAALESADIVLLSEDLAAVPWAVRLARRTRGIIAFNFALALAIIAGMGTAVLVGSGIGRSVPLWIAVLAHEGGTLLVVANSLRLLAAAPARVSAPAKAHEPIVEPTRALS